jgi:two-component system sensor histidine kinase/response regulator
MDFSRNPLQSAQPAQSVFKENFSVERIFCYYSVHIMDALPIILYVDDEPSNLAMFEAAFFEFYNIFTAETIGEANAILKQHPVEVILSDQRMPEMTGSRFLALSLGGRPDAVRMLVTGFSDIEDAIAAVNEGKIHRYIKKPWDNGDLRVAIDEAVRFYRVKQERDDLLQTLEEKVQERTGEISKVNEKLAEQNVQLASLNKEKNEILEIVSHDLKSPLSAIRGFAELLMLAGEERHTAEEREYINHIQYSVQRMMNLVLHILDSHLVGEGRFSVSLIHISMDGIANSFIEEYKSRAEEKNITLHYHNASHNLIYADEQKLYQVIDNIVSNAVKYSPLGKNVWIVVEDTDTSSQSSNLNLASVVLSVRDEGQGLSADELVQLFGRFVRLSPQPTGGEHSTGLGLFIAKKLVEAMDGRIWCESTVGEGCTFFVEFPIAKD